MRKLPDFEAYKILKKYEINAADSWLIKTEAELKLLAGNVGFPLYLKIDSPEIIHKARAGCVERVDEEKELAAKFRSIMKTAQKVTGHINGVIVQQGVQGNIEVIISGKNDKQFGPVVMFGAGGSFTEIENDVVFRIAPLTRQDARYMIRETKLYTLLSRFPISMQLIVNMIVNASNLIEKESLQELEINPVIVSEKSALAADVRMMR